MSTAAIAIRVVIALVALAMSLHIVNALRKAKTWKQFKCVIVNGSHELYRAHEDCRIFQQCFCGYETAGITVDRRDRRLHLVAHNPQPETVHPSIDYPHRVHMNAAR